MNNHILFGYQLDGKGGGKSLLNNGGYEETKSNSGIVWTHLDANHNGTRPWLDKEISSIDPYIVDALLANETRPRFRFCRKLSALVKYFQNQLSLDTVMLLLHKTDPKLSSFQH